MRTISDLSRVALSIENTHQTVTSMIQSNQPFLVGRPGGTESDGIDFFIAHRLNTIKKTPKPYSLTYRKLAKVGPGVTHFSDTDLDYFHLTYLQATLASDFLGYGSFASGALGLAKMMSALQTPIAPIENLEPLEALDRKVTPWTRALEGKRILVIHPFIESITNQFQRRQNISGVSDFLPDFALEVLRPPVTFAGETSERPWREHFEQLAEEVSGIDFDIAITGAGSYGLPIAYEAKKRGKQAIHLGGAVQLLFGIRGNRWEGSAPFSTYIDDTWTRPLPGEIPSGHTSVEGGAYW